MFSVIEASLGPSRQKVNIDFSLRIANNDNYLSLDDNNNNNNNNNNKYNNNNNNNKYP